MHPRCKTVELEFSTAVTLVLWLSDTLKNNPGAETIVIRGLHLLHQQTLWSNGFFCMDVGMYTRRSLVIFPHRGHGLNIENFTTRFWLRQKNPFAITTLSLVL